MAAQRDLTMRFLAQPMDVNFGGHVHGGSVLKWIDQAAYACAAGWSGEYCVTIFVDGVRFLKPIKIGELVELRSKIIFTGRTSMHVHVEVSARDTVADEQREVADCTVVFVAVDSSGQKNPVPKWTPQTTEDKCLHRYAAKAVELRKEADKELQNCLLD